jgi:hypothetical protein
MEFALRRCGDQSCRRTGNALDIYHGFRERATIVPVRKAALACFVSTLTDNFQTLDQDVLNDEEMFEHGPGARFTRIYR